MPTFPLFLSVILVLRNAEDELTQLLTGVSGHLAGLAEDYELIVVDNGSHDESVAVLGALAGPEGLANLQVFALTKEVDSDTAIAVGLENALGDFVAVLDANADDVSFLSSMLEAATSGSDVVFAANSVTPPQSLAYRAASWGFNALYRLFARVHLAKEAPSYRVLSRRVVNFILQHPRPAVAYRSLPATGGFTRTRLTYRAVPASPKRKRLTDSFDRGVRLLVSTTRGPMRLVTLLCIVGAAANLLYCFYVIAVAILKTDVAPGWVTLSLQQSGMFFLISLVLLVLGEYVLQMASLSQEGPAYHIAQEFTSVNIGSARRRLNIEEALEAADSVA